ncbi:hypothetical protein RAVI111496_03520 [Rahnella victoriana]
MRSLKINKVMAIYHLSKTTYLSDDKKQPIFRYNK